MTLLTDSLAALLWVGAAILLVLGVHRAASRLMPPPSAPDEHGHVSAPFRTPPGAFERLLETDIGTAPVLARAEGERRAARYRGTVP
jgi:hypothetical protein